MIVQIKVFIQPTLSPCAREAITRMYYEAKRNIENEYTNVEIEMMFWLANSAEARRLGVYQVGTLFIEAKNVLDGYHNRCDIERELSKRARAN